MHYPHSLGSVLVALTLLAGCSTLDDEWQRDRRPSNPPSSRCGVDVPYWRNRVDAFTQKHYKNLDNFQRDRGALVKAMNSVSRDGCGKRVNRQMDDLMRQVLLDEP